LLDVAADNLSLGTSVVIVGPFTKEQQQANWPAQLKTTLAARKFGGDPGLHASAELRLSIHVVFVYCPPEEQRLRLIVRFSVRRVRKLLGLICFLGSRRAA
jgi:hypothetical protein